MTGNQYAGIRLEGHSIHGIQLGNNYYSKDEPTCQDLLRDLLLTDPVDDLDKTRRQKGKRIVGTCEWILNRDELTTWSDGDDMRLLWLLGAPGIGKTMISCFLVDKLHREVQEQTSAVLMYYFCDGKDDQRSTAIAIVRGILVQLLRKHPELFGVIKDDYVLKKTSIVSTIDALWRPLLKMLQKANEDKIYILIDALDECERMSRKELLAMLGEIVELPKVRILITARPESDIEGATYCLGQNLRLDSAKINDDLSRFINIRVDELQEQKASFPPKLIEDIRTTLQEKAGGTFLWASLLLKDISQSETSRKARKKLDDLPSDLHDVYKRILENIKDDSNDAMCILQWVAVSRRPMTLRELATVQALATEEWQNSAPRSEDVDEFLDGYKTCGPLLYYDEGTDTINLVHHSAKDYLTGANCSPSRYQVDRDAASLSIVKTCWAYLAMPEFQNGSLVITRDRDLLEERQLSQRILKAYSFLGYATEELLRGVGDKASLLIAFVRQCERLHDLPPLRDFWLHTFAFYGHISGVQILLEKGADPRVTIRQPHDSTYVFLSGATLLHIGAAQRSIETCKMAIEHGVDVNAKMERLGDTALHLATSSGHPDIIRILVKNGANIEEKDASGTTALVQALARMSEDPALVLMEEGADTRATSSHGQTTLLLAAGNGFDRVVERLVARNVAINKLDDMGNSALSEAVKRGRVASVRMLIKAGADLQWKSTNGESLLHLAAWHGDEDVLTPLIKQGLDVNAWSARGTPLHDASSSANKAAVELLLKAGADIAIKDCDGRTALHLAAQGGHEDVVAVLLDAGAGIDTKAEGGLTAMHLAAQDGRYKVTKTLLARGAAVDALDDNGSTALHRAAASPAPLDVLDRVTQKQAETTRLLLSHGAKVDTVNQEGATPLHQAARTNRADIAAILLGSGASNDARDCNGRTPLFTGAAERHGTVCCRLLESGADATTMVEADEETYPKLDELRRLTECWLHVREHRKKINADNPNQGEEEHMADNLSDKIVHRGEGYEEKKAEEEMLRLLFEMAAFTKARDCYLKDVEECFVDACENGYDAVISMLLTKDMERSVWEALGLTHVNEAGRETLDTSLCTKSVPSDGRSALYVAAGEGHDSIVGLLLNHGANVEARYDDFTPLLIAARNGHARVVETLLNVGVNLSQGNQTGAALHWAAKEGHIDVVQVLLAHNADVDDSSGLNGATPLMMAVNRRHMSVAQRLLSAGADVAIKDDSGHTAMYWTLEQEGVPPEAIVSLLIEHGANPTTAARDIVSEMEITLLSWTGELPFRVPGWERRRVLSLLQHNREWLDFSDREDQILLKWAIERDLDDIVALLLDMGARMDVIADELLLMHPEWRDR
ncbi:NACHT and Ankyrin domain protein [Pleurostoma richardsiae]|uniref:NACHT and Ankyrin domain protein n=1 Tax=Pleurostoma richardsiae TaxID=41990 RepID=A0AA38VQ35_9PEZI|nr:NACHT and Ankyrin domain protein [Pleurostoma richardsiae]